MPVMDFRALGKDVSVAADVCVVGAGAAGLLLAASLARRGVRVVVIEAGGRIGAGERAVGMEAAVEGGAYRATTEGRAFGLGGTTSLWGGQLVPHSELDFRALTDGAFDFWRHAVGIVNAHAGLVADMLGLRPMCEWFHAEDCLPAGTAAALRARGLETVTADWLPFRKRNLSFLAERHAFDVYLNAPACAWDIGTEASGAARIRSVTARESGKSLVAGAGAFVLAAGAIETTRILLEMERRMGRPFREGAELGRNLSDHLSCRAADVAEDGRERAAGAFGPRFRDGRMRSFRFVEKDAPHDAPRAFFHFIFENENPGFALARKALLAMQARKIPHVRPGEAARGAAGVAALAWGRFARRRLYMPAGTPAHLQLDIEQTPDPQNRIVLSDSRDATGRPRARVRWSMRPADEEGIRAAAARFLAAWPGESACFPRLVPALGHASEVKPHDVYHPVGTCRMGKDAGAVVDPEARVHGAANLSVASTAVFPSAGTANPTFSMLCLAAALAERLAGEGRAGNVVTFWHE
jgi:choline dehydrogenase-like flavoprotein